MSNSSTRSGAADRVEATPPTALSVLVVGTDEWAIDQSAASLAAAGHRPLHCHDSGAPAFPCNAFLAGRHCPLDDGVDVVVTARARSGPSPMPSEMGATCAMRAGIPLVLTGISGRSPYNDLAAQVVPDGGSIARACEQAVATPPAVINLDEAGA